MNCTICNSTLDHEGYCPVCSFDLGLDYEHFPTLFDAEQMPSISARRNSWAQKTRRTDIPSRNLNAVPQRAAGKSDSKAPVGGNEAPISLDSPASHGVSRGSQSVFPGTDQANPTSEEKLKKTKRTMLRFLVCWLVLEPLFLAAIEAAPPALIVIIALLFEAAFFTFVIYLVKFVKLKRAIRKSYPGA